MESDGYVYLIKCWSEAEVFYKVGWSQTPTQRLAELQVGCPFPMKLADVVYGALEVEQAIHRKLKLAGRHVRGEWFRLTDEEADELFNGARRPGIANVEPAKRPAPSAAEPEYATPFGRPMRPAAGLNGEILRAVAKHQDSGERVWLMRLARELNRNPGQVRPAIVRLVANGYLVGEATDLKQVPAVYSITDRGRQALHEAQNGRRIEPGELRPSR